MKSRATEEQPQKADKARTTEGRANCSATHTRGTEERSRGGRGDNLAFV